MNEKLITQKYQLCEFDNKKTPVPHKFYRGRIKNIFLARRNIEMEISNCLNHFF